MTATETTRQPSLHEILRRELARGAKVIAITDAECTFTITDKQARQVLAGGELTCVLGKAVVK